MYDELVKRLRDFAVELRKAEDALLVRDAAEAIEELSKERKKGKWIPVTERLPEPGIDDCPLVDVPTPHGRLIDADALMKEITETCKRLYGTDDINTASPTLSAFKYYIGEAPTVIEAEE